MAFFANRKGVSPTSGGDGGAYSIDDEYRMQQLGTIYNDPGSGLIEGLTATGGVVTDYADGPKVYRAHLFSDSGTFNVTKLGSYPAHVEYLVVAGGGGGGVGGNSGGGGGAGGFRTNVPGTPGNHTTSTPYPISTSPGSYTVTIGAGGAGGSSPGGLNGSDTTFSTITSGGGGGAGPSSPPYEGADGGSGGGGSTASDNTAHPGGASLAVSTPAPWPGPATQGNAGGYGKHAPGVWEGGGGGGGAGAAGENATQAGPTTLGAGRGGIGIRSLIAGPAYPIGANGSTTSIGGWFAGGGGGQGGGSSNGGVWTGSAEEPGGPYSGAGGGYGSPGGPPSPTTTPGPPARGGAGDPATGGGGGGGSPGTAGGAGGSGFVAIRYQIFELPGTAQATGGIVSFYGGKTIHTFISSGTLVCPTSISSVEYVLVGGGGSGASAIGGGGGAGAYLSGSGITLPATTYPVVIGGGGGLVGPDPYPGYHGTDSTWNGLTAGGGGGGTGLVPTYDPSVGRNSTAPFGAAVGSGGGGGNGSGSISGGAGGSPSGFAGGNGNDPTLGSGGGGGSSQAGGNAPTNYGGTGLQLPTTFRDPGGIQFGSGPNAQNHWLAGGGGGGSRNSPTQSQDGGEGGGPTAPKTENPLNAGYGWAGAGNGTGNNSGPTIKGGPALANTGSGGGGAGDSGVPGISGSGGSGVLLIAYPT